MLTFMRPFKLWEADEEKRSEFVMIGRQLNREKLAGRIIKLCRASSLIECAVVTKR